MSPLVAVAALLSASPQAYLRWNFDVGRWSQTYRLCSAVSISWISPEGEVLWTRELPPRMRQIRMCECRRADDAGSCASEVATYLEHPQGGPPDFVLGTVVTKSAVLFADRTGIVALSRTDGAPLMNWDGVNEQAVPVRFDSATFTVSGKSGCKGEAQRGAFFAPCGKSWVYFNGTNAAWLTPSTLHVETAPVKPIRKSAPHVVAEVRFSHSVMRVTGVIYLH